jgi:hypothetical protein
MMLPEGNCSLIHSSFCAIADDTLVVSDTGKKVQLSDLEKQARKEENARRRKLQMDQKMENDRVCLYLTATDIR